MVKKKKTGFMNDLYHDSWLYIILLVAIVILGESLKGYGITLGSITLSYGIFILPAIFLLTNFITKKYSYTTSICAISASGVGMVLFYAVINFLLKKPISILDVSGEFCGYVVSQFINLSIYLFLLENTSQPKILVYLTYLFSLVVMYMFYTLLNLNILIDDTYWLGYFTTIIIQMFLLLPITIVDGKIKRGLN